MRKLKHQIKNLLIFCLITVFITSNSCSKKSEEQVPAQAPAEHSSLKAASIYGDRTINFARADGTYTLANANTDFGNIMYGWQESRAYISSQRFRIKLLANQLGQSCGLVSDVDIADGSSYLLTFSVYFPPSFIWGWGGKMGFGFLIGDGNVGCDPATDGNGGSARMMWQNTRSDGTGETFFRPYVYYRDMPGTCGNDFGVRWPASGSSLQKNTWYTIKIYVRSNTGSNTNGLIKYTINNNVILNRAIRWTTNDTKRLINELAVSTFRGGSTDEWKVGSDTYVYFDNVTWDINPANY